MLWGTGSAALGEKVISKTRADDFKGEIDELAGLLEGGGVGSPISLKRGLETMLVIAAAHRSHQLKRTI